MCLTDMGPSTDSINISCNYDSLTNASTFYYSSPTNFSKCIPIQKIFFDHVDLLAVQILFGILYSIVLVLGFVANVLTMYCLSSMPYHFGFNSKFLISLTMADLFMSITSLPITALQIFSRQWLLGPLLCQYVPLFQGACFFITSFTLVAIAIERYLNLANTSRVSYCNRHMFTVSLIWVFGFTASLPYAWYVQLSSHCVDNGYTKLCMCGKFCDEHWPSEIAKKVYGSSAFSIQFGLPLCALTFCYWRVRRTVYESVRRRLATENLSLMSKEKLIRRKKRTSFITLLLLFCFVVPWLPVSVMNLLRDYKILPEEHVSILFAIGHLFAMTSILWNPLIYCLYNREFMETFKYILLCKFSRRSSLSSSRNNETYDDDKENDLSDDDAVANGDVVIANHETSFCPVGDKNRIPSLVEV